MPAMYVKLGPCGGLVETWWTSRVEFCGRPTSHDGRCRRLPLADDSFALLVGAPFEEYQPLTGEARHDAVAADRARERAGEAKERQHQNEHHPERDDTRGVTRCKRCERLLAMDSRPEFRQLHPCSVLRG